MTRNINIIWWRKATSTSTTTTNTTLLRISGRKYYSWSTSSAAAYNRYIVTCATFRYSICIWSRNCLINLYSCFTNSFCIILEVLLSFIIMELIIYFCKYIILFRNNNLFCYFRKQQRCLALGCPILTQFEPTKLGCFNTASFMNLGHRSE